ncbi:MAG: hypothetical protein LBC07_04720 [Elusimicrobiota bacterium]|jgi:hypothetical protein|nr:hypothetical protein [Elusimicrobiota bacterium]
MKNLNGRPIALKNFSDGRQRAFEIERISNIALCLQGREIITFFILWRLSTDKT